MSIRNLRLCVTVSIFAAATALAGEATFEIAPNLDAAQVMSGGEKPILLDFYTDW